MRGKKDNASWQTRDYETVTLGATVDSTGGFTEFASSGCGVSEEKDAKGAADTG